MENVGAAGADSQSIGTYRYIQIKNILVKRGTDGIHVQILHR